MFDALMADLKRSTKLFMDETRAPVLDPIARQAIAGNRREGANARPKPVTSGRWPAMIDRGEERHPRVWLLPTRRGGPANMQMIF